MAIEIVCNFHKCRKALSNHAWVTTCSHAFCTKHGKQEFAKNDEDCLTCPACGTELRDKFDVIQANLRPNETFKTIVLAGLKPEVVMDIALRAMSFWTYQMEQEIIYQESFAKHTRDKLHTVKEVNTLTQQKLESKLEQCKRKISCLQTECNKKSQLAENMKARLADKNKEIQMLMLELDLHKRVIDSETIPKTAEQKQCVNDLLRMVNTQSLAKIGMSKANLNHSNQNCIDGYIVLPRSEDKMPRICSLKSPMYDIQDRKSRQLKHCHVRPVDF